jgi:uncharacterized membrane protein
VSRRNRERQRQLKSDARKELLSKIGVSVERFSGPLPPPEVLEKYNNIEPGFANRILRMAESQAQHRQHLEKTVVEGRTRAEGRAQILGTILALAIGAGAIFLVYTGHSVEGVVALVAELAALAGVFIYGRKRQERENREKQESLVRSV